MSLPRTSLADAHNALSHLHFAVAQELDGLAVWGVKIGYHAYPGLGLFVEVETRERDAQQVMDRLEHGVLWGQYDYRFSVGRELSPDPQAWVKVTAYPVFNHREPLEPARLASRQPDAQQGEEQRMPTIWEDPAGKGYPCFERPMTPNEARDTIDRLGQRIVELENERDARRGAQCANCGSRDFASVIAGDDGEAFCSVACLDQHEELGCPLESGDQYRTAPFATPPSPALDAATIERCAQVAEGWSDPAFATMHENCCFAAIAAAIRALPNAEKRHG